MSAHDYYSWLDGVMAVVPPEAAVPLALNLRAD